jgi:hypothetical protein
MFSPTGMANAICYLVGAIGHTAHQRQLMAFIKKNRDAA